jgi:hypothetical protein
LIDQCGINADWFEERPPAPKIPLEKPAGWRDECASDTTSILQQVGSETRKGWIERLLGG